MNNQHGAEFLFLSVMIPVSVAVFLGMLWVAGDTANGPPMPTFTTMFTSDGTNMIKECMYEGDVWKPRQDGMCHIEDKPTVWQKVKNAFGRTP